MCLALHADRAPRAIPLVFARRITVRTATSSFNIVDALTAAVESTTIP